MSREAGRRIRGRAAATRHGRRHVRSAAEVRRDLLIQIHGQTPADVTPPSVRRYRRRRGFWHHLFGCAPSRFRKRRLLGSKEETASKGRQCLWDFHARSTS